jgi:hypothetical protein
MSNHDNVRHPSRQVTGHLESHGVARPQHEIAVSFLEIAIAAGPAARVARAA